MEAQISHLIGDDQTPAQPTTVGRSEIQLQFDEERNKYGRVKNLQWKKKICESNKLGGGEKQLWACICPNSN